ncbi:MAG: sigma-70 family RNA polymerase sigma factor [Planctomycetia bacterium]|nr:sigma-70 family RNA polymerase sigma factor [Planctomycetia bacterium]
MTGPSTTSPSLLASLADGSGREKAWAEFVRIYSPHVLRWCRRYGLQESDAADVAEDVLLRFFDSAADFEYDPRKTFRGSLRRIVTSAVSDWGDRRRADRLATGDSAVQDQLFSQPAREDLLARLEAAYDTELLSLAMRRCSPASTTRASSASSTPARSTTCPGR